MEVVGRILGHYEIRAKIGTGGMATVYRAWQPSLGREVAVKVLSGDLARDKEFRERFLREARAIAQLTHPNILPVYDSGEDEETGTLYFVMQLVDGGTLAQRLEAGPLDVAEAVRITAHMARALDYAHRRGVVHRDIKPANVLLTSDGHPFLSDFGIARMMQETRLTQTGIGLGTPAYMSPEQARGEPVDHRADIYALGIMAYEMLTGQVPFQADTPVGMLHLHAFMPPPPLCTVCPSLPKTLERVVMQALAKFPAERYASAGEFADALEAALTGASTVIKGKRARRTRDETRAMSPAGAATGLPLVAPAGQSAPVVLTTQRQVTLPVRMGRAALGFGKWLARTLVIALLVSVIFSIMVTIGGTFVLGRVLEDTIARANWDLDTVDVEAMYTYYRSDFAASLSESIEPYTLDALSDLYVVFESPDGVIFGGNRGDQDITVQFSVDEEDGIPVVQVERLNDIPLYVVGGIISNNANRGLERAWEDAPVRIAMLRITPDEMTVRYRRR